MQHLVQQAPRSGRPAYETSGIEARNAVPVATDALNAGGGVRSLMQLQDALNRRPAVVAQRQLARQLSRRAADGASPAPVQRANPTGLPDQLKAGTENLSGLSLDDVRVHYNSAEPATLQAAAYAQGSDIHVGPGQERHLPHEAWHVVQQKQGRVRPTLQAKGVAINDDSGLEREADTMGAQALLMPAAALAETPMQAGSSHDAIQRVIGTPPQGAFMGNLEWGEWFSAMTVDEVGQEALKLGLARAALNNMNEILQRHRKALIPIPPAYAGPDERAVSQSGYAKSSGSIESASAIGMVEIRRPPVEALSDVPPHQPQGRERMLSARQVGAILGHADFRHGVAEARQMAVAFRDEEDGSRVDLANLLRRLRTGSKEQMRTAYLIQLTVNDLESGDGIAAPDAWGMFARVFEFIRAYARTFNANAAGPAENGVGALTDFPPSTWQAAAIAALRSRELNSTGFQCLSELLFMITGKLMLDYRSPDVQHEIALRRPAGGRTGTAEHPSYRQVGPSRSVAEKIKYLNNQSSSFHKLVQSGAYVEQEGLIAKTLDLGHTGVDMIENIAHRNKTTVQSATPFDYLALLSPNRKRQAVGAQGAVLGDGSYMFVVDRQFRFRYLPAANYVGEGGVAKNFVQYIPHSQLAERQNVLAAGNFFVRQGHIIWIDNGSGHYRVNAAVNRINATASLEALGYNVFDIRFLDRGAGDLDAMYKRGNRILDTFDSGRPAASGEVGVIERIMSLIASVPNTGSGDHKSSGDVKSGGGSATATNQSASSGSGQAANRIPVRWPARMAQNAVIDPVFGQNVRLTEHIGDAEL